MEREMNAMQRVSEKFTAAGRLLSRGEIDKAEDLVAQIPAGIPQGSVMYNTLGDVRARMGRWPLAIKHYSRSVSDDPTNHLAYDCLATLLVWTGDVEGYQPLRQRILRRFGATTDPAVAQALTRACLLVPPAPADVPAIVKMASANPARETASGLDPSSTLVAGLLEFRLGHFVTAARLLQPVAAQEGDTAHVVQAAMVLAMTQQQLQRTNDARATLARGLKLAGDNGPNPASPDWNERLTAQILMREAKSTMPDAPGAPADAK
jgi:hypothetical protein